MKYLIVVTESTVWAHYSTATFLLCFCLLIWRVFRPAAKGHYEQESRIVFDDGKKS